MYKVIATGSAGNAVLYHHGSILVDIGVPFALIEPFLHDIQLVLLTHYHEDHINHSTLRRVCFERPTLRVGCCGWMFEDLPYPKGIDIYQLGRMYDYHSFQISPIKLYHDVENCGYRIIKPDYKIIHATDTAHLNGIEAIDYDLYAIEHNYDEDTINELCERKEARGEFNYKKRALNNHLSEQQARDFIFKNKVRKCEVLRLHESNINY